jgi:hypothetical protein
MRNKQQTHYIGIIGGISEENQLLLEAFDSKTE